MFPTQGGSERSSRRGYSMSPSSEKRRRAARAGNKPSHLGLTAVAAMTALRPRLTGLCPPCDRAGSPFATVPSPSPKLPEGASVPALVLGGRLGRGSGHANRSGRDSGAGQANPPAEGGRKPKQIHPPRLCPTPLQNTNGCAIVSHEVGQPARFSFSEPAAYILHWRLNTEHPPVAGALREQPKGQDPPRKVGTGVNAVVRHRLFGAIQLRNGS